MFKRGCNADEIKDRTAFIEQSDVGFIDINRFFFINIKLKAIFFCLGSLQMSDMYLRPNRELNHRDAVNYTSTTCRTMQCNAEQCNAMQCRTMQWPQNRPVFCRCMLPIETCYLAVLRMPSTTFFGFISRFALR